MFILFRNRAVCRAVMVAAGLLVLLSGCKSSVPRVTDILSQKKTEAGRTLVTVLVKYAFSINSFEKAVESKFPDIDLVQVGNYTHNMGIDEYQSRIKSGDLTDIVMTWPLEVGQEYWEDRLMDLSGMEFTSRYNLSMLNDISRDGKLYYLPGPAQVRGIVYNKTLFEENGWKVPKDFEGFISLCKEIEASGLRSIQMGFDNEEVLDTAFVGYNYGAFYSKPQDAQWLEEYNNGTGSFGEHFSPALDVFQRMIDEGIWKKEDLDIDYAEREKMFFNRQCAMVEDSVLFARMGYGSTGITDEFALMPFFNPGQDGDWARLYMVCFVGLNKRLAQPENKEKYDMVMTLMDYISSPEGQEALAADTGAMFSSLSDMAPPDVKEVRDLESAFSHGRYAVFPQLKNSQQALREGLAGMVRGDTTKEEVIERVDIQNRHPKVPDLPRRLGSASESFTMIETGNFVTDVMREFSGCEIALFLDNGKDGRYNGKGISASFYEGDVTVADIGRILPDLKHGEDGVLWKCSISGEDLIKTLEYALPVDNNATGWFYYFSGLKAEFDPQARPGGRIKSVTVLDGTKIQKDRLYSLAVMDMSVPDEYLKSCEKTEITIAQILEEAIEQKGTIAPSKDGRFVVVQ